MSLFIPTEGHFFSFYSFYKLLFGNNLYRKTKDHYSYTRKQMLGFIENQFEIQEINYAYHLFGSFFDATFFAACLIPAVAKWFWTKNTRFNKPNEKKSLASHALELANFICFWESSLLRKVSFSSSGVLVKVKKKSATLLN